MKSPLFISFALVVLLLAGCGAPAEVSSDTMTNVLSSSNMSFADHNLNPSEAGSFIADNSGNENFAVLDVRTPEERTGGCIKNSLNIDFYEASFANELSKLDKAKTYLVYCRSGRRSGESMKMMEGLGFENVYNLDGGIGAWQENGGDLAGTC